MSGIVFKQSYKCRSRKSSTVILNVKHLVYIATRPGAVHNKGCAFGLWGRLTEQPHSEHINDLRVAKQTIKQVSAEHTVWRAIISVDKDTAKKHDLYRRSTWEAVIERQISVLAQEMDIKKSDFRWVASMHYVKGHPHVHIMYWDDSSAIHPEAPPKERFSIMAEHVRSAFGRDIYKEEILEQRQQQKDDTALMRQQLCSLIKEANLAEALDLSHISRPEHDRLTAALVDLASTVPTKGALKYKFMPEEYKEKLHSFIDEVLKISDFQKVVKQYKAATLEISSLNGNGEAEKAYQLDEAMKKLYADLGNEVLQAIKEYRLELGQDTPADPNGLRAVLQHTALTIALAHPQYQELAEQMPRLRTPPAALMKDPEFSARFRQLTNDVADDIRVNGRLKGYIHRAAEDLTDEERKELTADIYRQSRREISDLLMDKLCADAGYPAQAQADAVTDLLIRLLGDASRGAGQQQARRDLLRRRDLSKTAQRDRQAQRGQGGAWQQFEL